MSCTVYCFVLEIHGHVALESIHGHEKNSAVVSDHSDTAVLPAVLKKQFFQVVPDLMLHAVEFT